MNTYASVKDIEALRDLRLDQLHAQRVAAGQYVDSLHSRLGALQALRQERRDFRAAAGQARLTAAAADKSGALVIEADRIGKSYEDRPIVSDFSTRIQRGDRIGIVGPNGSGKTTLVSLLTGALPPDSGTLRLGVNLEMATPWLAAAMARHRRKTQSALRRCIANGHRR